MSNRDTFNLEGWFIYFLQFTKKKKNCFLQYKEILACIKTIKTHERLWRGKFNIARLVFALATSTFHSVLVGQNDSSPQQAQQHDVPVPALSAPKATGAEFHEPPSSSTVTEGSPLQPPPISDEETKKWGSHVMGAPPAPNVHPDNQC